MTILSHQYYRFATLLLGIGISDITMFTASSFGTKADTGYKTAGDTAETHVY